MLTRTLSLSGRTWTVHEAGEASDPALLLLHGFTGSGLNWEELASKLPGWRIVAPDLPGHGGTDAPTGRMPEVALDLVALLDQLEIAQALVIGYSMGGRLALHLAVAAPERVRALVVIGATPGLAEQADREARMASDEALARKIETRYEDFVRDWETLPMFGTQQALSAASRERIGAIRRSQSPEALAAAMRLMGTGAQPPLHGRLPELSMPVLWVVGEYDAKFREIAESVRPLLPNARQAIVPYAGHAVHLERPSAFKTLLLSFAEKLPPVSVLPPSPRRSDA